MSGDLRPKEHAPATERPDARQQVTPSVESARPANLQAARLVARGVTGATDSGGATDGLMQLQRTAGNRAVTSLLAPVQRWPSLDDAREAAGNAGNAVADGAQAVVSGAQDLMSPREQQGGGDGAAPSSSGGSPRTPGPDDASVGGAGYTTVTGSQIELSAPMVTAPGVLQVDTLIANNVVGSNYTPGAGNVW